MADDAPKPADFFLDGSEPDDSYDYGPTPARPGINVKPLIDAEDALSAMEAAIVAAQKSVLLSFWVLDLAVEVQNKALGRAGTRTWGDLLSETVKRGVTVRVLLTDFDPLLQKPLHREAWKAQELLLRLGAMGGGDLEVLVSMHPAFTGFGAGKELADALDATAKEANANPKGVVDTLRHHPGAWAWLEYSAPLKKVSVRKGGPPLVARIASHHQKLCIVDETLAFCGGLDVAKGRIDNMTHTGMAWHDVHVQVDAQAALDIHHNFVTRWNHEAKAYLAFVAEANKTGMPVTLPLPTATTPLAHATAKPKPTGTSLVQIQRTLSQDAKFGVAPTTLVKDVVRSYEKAIAQARQYIYIENQYVREPKLADWIITRALAVKELVVIVVLPVAPEEVTKAKIDPITNHGLFRQRELLERLAKVLGPRFGMYSAVQRSTANKPHLTNTHGSTQVYVHSKLMLIDDTWVTIGSANANPRSFYVDTELNASFHDPEVATRLRLRLWTELLGSPKGLTTTWKPADFVAEWNKIARANVKASPTKRSGFIVPHDPARFPGVLTPGLPNELVDLIDGAAVPPDQLPA